MTHVLGAQLQESELQAKLTVREALELYAAFYPRPLDWRPLAERLRLTAKLTTRVEEAQRLCDRIALIDKGRVTVLDTPRPG